MVSYAAPSKSLNFFLFSSVKYRVTRASGSNPSVEKMGYPPYLRLIGPSYYTSHHPYGKPQHSLKGYCMTVRASRSPYTPKHRAPAAAGVRNILPGTKKCTFHVSDDTDVSWQPHAPIVGNVLFFFFFFHPPADGEK